jgi:cell division protein FtsQ
MSGEFTYENYGQSEEFRPKTASTRKIEKGLKRILVAAAVIIAAECLWLFGVSPCIPFSTLEVNGFPGFDGQAVLGFAGITDKSSFISTTVMKAENTLAGHYLVESARVVKRFPDRLSVFLEPRKAVASSLVLIQGRLMPILFDRNGVVFGIGESSDWESLPVLSGLVIEQPSLGMKLPAALAPLLEEIGRIQDETPYLLDLVSEIRVNRKPFDGFDLVLYPVHYPVRVRLGNSLSEETLRYVMLMLDVFKRRKIWPQEIDFRSGMSSYTVKEASSVE